MRDIRQDLQERLGSVEAELSVIQQRCRSLESQRETLKTLIAAENDRWQGVAQRELPINGDGIQAEPPSGTVLASILRECLADHKRHHLDELSEAAIRRGYPFGQKKPGRVIHFALLGMKSGSAIEQLGDGYWRLSES